MSPVQKEWIISSNNTCLKGLSGIHLGTDQTKIAVIVMAYTKINQYKKTANLFIFEK
jgi:hypothetical protein